ncbi:hypothetical protein LCGC14_2096350 [marine sediment metagenome]|uniref:Uncharacterized protein n=1 Tax=marine sediment metagenome TaxID=412755 RepID=A0A0F9EB98_9ZZZZ
MNPISCQYSDLLDPCGTCNTPNPRAWRYLYPHKQRGESDLYCWGVFCEECRSHEVTEANKHEEIEDAIEAWNENYGNDKQKT